MYSSYHFLLLLCCLSPTAIIMALDCFPPDLQALRTFAPHVAGLDEIWGPGNDCCSWQGITCTISTASGESPRVSGLSLSKFFSLTSNFLEPLCNLSLLSTLYLESTDDSTRPNFYMLIPPCLGYLSALRNLSLHYLALQGPLPSSFSRLLHLQYLDVHDMQSNICLLSGTLLPISSLPNLTYVVLSFCAFSGPLPPFRTPLLQHLDLSLNSFNSTLHDFSLLSNLPSLTTLDLSYNQISGSIPLFSNLPSLTTLRLSGNQISGSIPPSIFARLPNLGTLFLESNRLSGEIPESFCELAFNTSLDSMECKFISLTWLSLAGNRFTGPFPRWIGHLPSLQVLSLSAGNDFRGPLPEEWKNLQKLHTLDLSGNSLLPSQLYGARLPDWLFHFPLKSLTLASCGLHTQDVSCNDKLSLFNQSLQTLDLRGNHLTGRDTLECFALHNFSQLGNLYLSTNPLSIVLSNVLLPPHVDYLFLGSCNLKGVDPLENAPLAFRFMDLSHNALAMDLPSFLTSIRLNCDPKNLFTEGIDLSHNALVGEIPSFLGLCNKQLKTIKIRNNSLVGRIPDELGGLAYLEELTLNNNHLNGTIPASIMVIGRLTVLDLSYNDLEGNLNTLFSFSSTTFLRAVLLSHNRINGSIPISFGTFMPSLQLIDFSNNRLTGTIPQTLHLPYFRNLQATNMNYTTNPPSARGSLNEEFQLVVKGLDLEYLYVQEAMTALDLSGNYLEGAIPADMGDLEGLIFLNLSHNNLSGSIPSNFAKLTRLQSLDLSFNQLEGSLPSQLSNLTKLSNFNVSFNTGLRGSIPQGPQFETSESYKGDPLLCGSPTLQDCKPSVVPHTTVQPTGSIKARWIHKWIALPGLSLGFVIGFVTTLFLLHYKRKMS